MEKNNVLKYIEDVLQNMPSDWLKLTTHRLDIYNEGSAKTEFLERFDSLYEAHNTDTSVLSELPTAYDYIRLGHPLSSVLEWTLAKLHSVDPASVISFSSRTMPILAVLRKNHFDKKETTIYHTGNLPEDLDLQTLKSVYGYSCDTKQVDSINEIPMTSGSAVYVTSVDDFNSLELNSNTDFLIAINEALGSVLFAIGEENVPYISAIQHVRRRESIAMTPANCHTALRQLLGSGKTNIDRDQLSSDKTTVLGTIRGITGTDVSALLGSCGLSIQYAIMMGLIDHTQQHHPDKEIRIIVPPNCYGGTNDQARRVAACLDNVEILDLPVDGDNDMVQSTDTVLRQVAEEDAVPFIIAEIPTNPRVEVPELEALRDVLQAERKTSRGEAAVPPVFILDQTFCPNVQFLSEEGILSDVRTISYVSGSKFPSGGKCTAGYCVANEKAQDLMPFIEKHLKLTDNEATALQVSILAEQLPSMLDRIAKAYKNTREFVTFIEETLPTAKINFVSEELAKEGFTPSVFSLDLPTKGDTHEERENHKRELNKKLINMMIEKIPGESKYCVSYGQLKGCYWTIPATSTQGTTKEDDKDYIARVSVSPDLDLEKHKAVFKEFVRGIS